MLAQVQDDTHAELSSTPFVDVFANPGKEQIPIGKHLPWSSFAPAERACDGTSVFQHTTSLRDVYLSNANQGEENERQGTGEGRTHIWGTMQCVAEGQ